MQGVTKYYFWDNANQSTQPANSRIQSHLAADIISHAAGLELGWQCLQTPTFSIVSLMPYMTTEYDLPSMHISASQSHMPKQSWFFLWLMTVCLVEELGRWCEGIQYLPAFYYCVDLWYLRPHRFRDILGNIRMR